MVKIPDRRPKPPGEPVTARAAALVPGWLPLAIAVLGFATLLSPDEVPWPLRALGAAALAAGSFWLGQDRQRDPHDRTRIVQLERALLAIGVLSRERGAAEDGGVDGGRPRTAPAHDGPDAPVDRQAGRHASVAGTRPFDLDAPLPGE